MQPGELPIGVDQDVGSVGDGAVAQPEAQLDAPLDVAPETQVAQKPAAQDLEKEISDLRQFRTDAESKLALAEKYRAETEQRMATLDQQRRNAQLQAQVGRQVAERRRELEEQGLAPDLARSISETEREHLTFRVTSQQEFQQRETQTVGHVMNVLEVARDNGIISKDAHDSIQELLQESSNSVGRVGKLTARIAKLEREATERKQAEVPAGQRFDSGVASPAPGFNGVTITQAQVNDPVWWAKNREAVMKAYGAQGPGHQLRVVGG